MQTQEIKSDAQAKPAPTETAAKPAPVREVTPPIDVLESADGLTVLVDLPGVPPSALSLDVEKDQLTLQGRRVGTPLVYVRTFVMPRDVDADRIEAKLEAGLLTLTLPRAQSAKPRQIPIKSS